MNIVLEHVINYQMSYFGTETHVLPEPMLIGRLLSRFQGKDLLPNTTTELQLNENIETRLQLQFISPNQEWLVAFESKRINVRKQSVPGYEIGSMEKFSSDAVEILTNILQEIDIRGNRLALVVKGLIEELPPEDLKLVYGRVLAPLPYYAKHLPSHWTTRSVARHAIEVGEKEELANIITDISRSQGKIKDENNASTDFDRIELGFEVNTFQNNTSLRFDTNDLEPFVCSAARVMTDLYGEVRNAIIT